MRTPQIMAHIAGIVGGGMFGGAIHYIWQHNMPDAEAAIVLGIMLTVISFAVASEASIGDLALGADATKRVKRGERVSEAS